MITEAIRRLLNTPLNGRLKAKFAGFSANMEDRAHNREEFLMMGKSSPLLEPKDQLTVDLLKMYDYARVVRNFRQM